MEDTKKKMKIIEYVINEDDQKTGVYCMSLVENPAILVNWIALSKQEKTEELKFAAVENGEQRMLYGPVMIPDQLIYRYNDKTKEEWMATYKSETIKTIAQKYMRNSMHQYTNLEHEIPVQGVNIVETWIQADPEKDKSAALGFTTPPGTWYIGGHVEDDGLWQDVKNGIFKGWSLEGYFLEHEEKMMDEYVIEQILDEMIEELNILEHP